MVPTVFANYDYSGISLKPSITASDNFIQQYGDRYIYQVNYRGVQTTAVLVAVNDYVTFFLDNSYTPPRLVPNPAQSFYKLDHNDNVVSAIEIVRGAVTDISQFLVYQPPNPERVNDLSIVNGDGQITLHWTFRNYVSSYDIYRDGVKIGNTQDNYYIDTGLTNGETYVYKIKSINVVGESSFSNEVIGQPTEPQLDTPSNLSVINGDGKVTLSWSPVTKATGYHIYRDDAYYAYVDTTTFIDTNVTNGETYKYQVMAVNGYSSELSDPVYGKPVEEPKPLNLNLIGNKYSILVQVSGGTPPYYIDWGDGSDTFNSSQYVITGLSENTTYEITVRDSDNQEITRSVNTGMYEGFIPPVMPNPEHLFQQMIDNFGTAGTIAIAIIGGAVALGILVILGMWGWRLAKRWLAIAK